MRIRHAQSQVSPRGSDGPGVPRPSARSGRGFPSPPPPTHAGVRGAGGDTTHGDTAIVHDSERKGMVSSGGRGIIPGVSNNGISGTGTRHVPVAESHRDYYLTVSGATNTNASSGGADYNSYIHHNNNNPSTINTVGDIIGGSHTNSSVRNNTTSNGVSSGSGVNRTLSEILSFVDHGAGSSYGDGSSSSSSNDGSSSSQSGGSEISGGVGVDIGNIQKHLGLDRILNDPHTSGADYDHNKHVLFDNGIEFVRGNVSLAELDSFSQRLLDRIEFKMGDDLTRYAVPAIIVLGNISNLVAFLVLRRKKYKKNSVAFYMRAYALANICCFNLMLGVAWLCMVLEIQYVANRTDWSCRLWTFISNVITYSGIWFVVVMGIDRFVYTNLPSKSPGYCSVFTAKGITTFVIICLIVVSIHAMWTFELQPQGCYVPYKDDILIQTWPWWSAALYSYIPQLLLLLQIVAQTICFIVRVCLKQPHSPPNSRQSGDQDTLVIPVFIITVAFFFLTIPSVAINLLDIHLPSNLIRVDVIAKIDLAKKISELLGGFNNCLLGIVLLALSPTYRSELLALHKAIFCCARSRTLKVFEMRTLSQSDDSSPHMQVDYELCNNNEENLATDV